MNLVEPDDQGGILFNPFALKEIRIMMGQLYIIAADRTPIDSKELYIHSFTDKVVLTHQSPQPSDIYNISDLNAAAFQTIIDSRETIKVI